MFELFLSIMILDMCELFLNDSIFILFLRTADAPYGLISHCGCPYEMAATIICALVIHSPLRSK